MADPRPTSSAKPKPERAESRSKRRIVWSLNPKDTSTGDVYWFLAVPVGFSLVLGAAIVTAMMALPR